MATSLQSDWKYTEFGGSTGGRLRRQGRTGDPSTICLSVAEMQRLIEIESAAQTALNAMHAVVSPNKRFADALDALATALANPVHGGQ